MDVSAEIYVTPSQNPRDQKSYYAFHGNPNKAKPVNIHCRYSGHLFRPDKNSQSRTDNQLPSKLMATFRTKKLKRLSNPIEYNVIVLIILSLSEIG